MGIIIVLLIISAGIFVGMRKSSLTIKWRDLIIIMCIFAIAPWIKYGGAYTKIHYGDDKTIAIESYSNLSEYCWFNIEKNAPYGKINYYFVDDGYDLKQCDDYFLASVTDELQNKQIDGAFVNLKCVKQQDHRPTKKISMESGERRFVVRLHDEDHHQQDTNHALYVQLIGYESTVLSRVMNFILWLFLPYGLFIWVFLLVVKVVQCSKPK